MSTNNDVSYIKSVQKGVLGSIIAILFLTVLEFPQPVGFETRPQDNVSMLWLVLFLIILVTEIVATFLIFKRPKLGAKIAIGAGVLNILQIAADQLHLMQLEIAPLGYTLLEYSVGLISLLLIYFAWKIHTSVSTQGTTETL